MAKTKIGRQTCTEEQRRHLRSIVCDLRKRNPKSEPDSAVMKKLKAQHAVAQAHVDKLEAAMKTIRCAECERKKLVNKYLNLACNKAETDILFSTPQVALAAVDNLIRQFDDKLEDPNKCHC